MTFKTTSRQKLQVISNWELWLVVCFIFLKVFYVIKGRIMVTVHQSSVVLGTGSTFFVPQGEFYHFFVFCTFYGLTIHWVQKVFFSSATFAVRFWSVSKPTHLRPEPRPRVAKPRENDDRFFEGINPIFARVFHLVRLGRKRKPRKKSLWHPG